MLKIPGESPQVRRDRRPLTVLLVDDVEENLELLADVLSDHGYTTVRATGGVEALDIASRQDVHLIISDAMMPRMDGFELCKSVKRHPKLSRLPFIIYTGNYVDEEDQELARNVGVDRYVMKYAGLGSLVESVDSLMLRHYGYQSEPEEEPPGQIDDHLFLEKHHELVTKKLEEKMNELAMYAATLEKKNRELRVSEDRYRTLFEDASIAIFVVDSRSKRVLEANKRGLELLDYSPEEVRDLPEFPFTDEEGSIPVLLTGERIKPREAFVLPKNGEKIAVDISGGPVAPAPDPRIMVFVRDIREQRKIKERLIQVEKMTLMGRLAAGIAHEIRNPLAGVSLNLQYLQRKLPAGSPEYESLTAALEGAERIKHVIEDTLGLARVTPPTLREESLNVIVSRSLSFLTVPLQQKKLSLAVHLESDIPAVIVDFQQIQQVVLNIVQNAIDASPEGGTITVVTGTLDADPDQRKTIEVSVEDQGGGIPDEVAAHLFEPFRTSKPGGTGLGLALSKYIIDRHQGEIFVEKGMKGGTVIRLRFPTSYSVSGGVHVQG